MASNAVDPTSNVEAPLITPLIAMKTAPLIAPAVNRTIDNPLNPRRGWAIFDVGYWTGNAIYRLGRSTAIARTDFPERECRLSNH